MIQLVLPKAFWHFDRATLQPSAACNSSQTAWLQFGLFFRRWQNAYPESQELGNDCCLKKRLLDFFKLGQNHFCSLFTEIVKMIYLKCSEAFFFEADTCLAPGKDEPLQWHCQGTEGLGSSSAGNPWGGGGQLAECELAVCPGAKAASSSWAVWSGVQPEDQGKGLSLSVQHSSDHI